MGGDQALEPDLGPGAFHQFVSAAGPHGSIEAAIKAVGWPLPTLRQHALGPRIESRIAQIHARHFLHRPARGEGGGNHGARRHWLDRAGLQLAASLRAKFIDPHVLAGLSVLASSVIPAAALALPEAPPVGGS